MISGYTYDICRSSLNLFPRAKLVVGASRAQLFWYKGTTQARGLRVHHVAGKGTMVFQNGDKYEGSWASGKFEGTGDFWTYQNGRYMLNYRGQWKSGTPHVRCPNIKRWC